MTPAELPSAGKTQSSVFLAIVSEPSTCRAASSMHAVKTADAAVPVLLQPPAAACAAKLHPIAAAPAGALLLLRLLRTSSSAGWQVVGSTYTTAEDGWSVAAEHWLLAPLKGELMQCHRGVTRSPIVGITQCAQEH